MSYNEEIESYGYVVKDDKQIYTKKEIFYAYDKNGYIIRTTLQQLYKNKNNIRFIDKNNIYSIDNIKLWLLKNNKNFSVISKEYKSNSVKLTCVCHIHQKEFYTNWNNISSGRGCPLCCTDGKKIRLTHSKEQVINDFIKVHGKDRYDYSLMNYVNTNTKIKIKCNKCSNIFEMMPYLHKQGQRCPECAKRTHGKWKIKSKEELLCAFNKIHNNKFTYDLSNYINSRSKITVICPSHGKFKTTAQMHMTGRDCIECSRELTGWSKSRWLKASLKSKKFTSFKVYIIKCWNENELFYKIGRTFRNINKRFHCDIDMPYNYELLRIIDSNNGEYIFDLENYLHKVHQQHELKYIPLIEFNGMYECFKEILNINEILLDFNNTICNI